jgi:hypothetical protein
MNETDNFNYYSIIPAKLLLDTTITPNAIRIYGVITALTNKEGYCWATNNYFSKLLKLSVRQVSSLINILIKKEYLTVKMIRNTNSNSIKERQIYIGYGKKIPEGIEENFNPPIEENCQENNIIYDKYKKNNNNNITNIKKEKKEGIELLIYIKDNPEEYNKINNFYMDLIYKQYKIDNDIKDISNTTLAKIKPKKDLSLILNYYIQNSGRNNKGNIIKNIKNTLYNWVHKECYYLK